MKLIICAAVVSLIKFSNGSSLEIDIAGGLPSTFYPNVFPYQSFGGINVEFGTNSDPFRTDYSTYFEAPCTLHLTDELILDFRKSIFTSMALVFKKAAALADGHFVISPHTAWLSLSALAEGTEGPTRRELFKILNLPEDRCRRQIFYELATTREYPSYDVVFARNRVLVMDTNVHVNRNWERIAQSTHLHTALIPFKSNPEEIEALKKIFKAKLLNLNLDGNSFLLESLDYHGLWSSAFSDAVIETGPFYNTNGEEIGTMQYMKTKKQVNIAYVPSVNMKIIEIPVGVGERYRMMIATALDNDEHTGALSKINDNLIFETLSNFRPTPAPIEIVIPRLTMTSEIDMRKVLEDLEIDGLWMDPTVTRNISNPAALPSGYIQRVSVTLDHAGLGPSIHEYYNIVPAPQTGDVSNADNLKSFVANRPFMFGVFDYETYTVLFAATFSKPSA